MSMRPGRGVRISLLAPCLFSACAIALPRPEEVIAPPPIEGNAGRYLSPYTTDEVVARWVSRGASARLGASLGRTAGAFAGQMLVKNRNRPKSRSLLAGLLGSGVGDTVGREVAIAGAGGWDYIRSTSDLSFDSIGAMCVWLYATYGASEHYAEVLDCAMEVYPEMKAAYAPSIVHAPRRTPPPDPAP